MGIINLDYHFRSSTKKVGGSPQKRNAEGINLNLSTSLLEEYKNDSLAFEYAMNKNARGKLNFAINEEDNFSDLNDSTSVLEDD